MAVLPMKSRPVLSVATATAPVVTYQVRFHAEGREDNFIFFFLELYHAVTGGIDNSIWFWYKCLIHIPQSFDTSIFFAIIELLKVLLVLVSL